MTFGADPAGEPSVAIFPGAASQSRAATLRSIDELDEPLVKREACRTLANARVVWANYDVIQRDFADVDFTATLPRGGHRPERGALYPTERPDIDAWLLSYAAIMSEAQLRFLEHKDKIPVVGPSRVAYRPPRYGRALVVQLGDSWPDDVYLRPEQRPRGLLDVKGCGVALERPPSLELHRTGLLGLPIAFGELATQGIVERIFDYLKVDVSGVPIYAILDLGFWAKTDRGGSMPAGAIIRRPHRRPVGNIERPNYGTSDHRIKLGIEFMLRPFGMTSCAPVMRFRIWREGGDLRSQFRGGIDKIPPAALERFLMRMSLKAPVDFDLVNVQLARGATLEPFAADLVDFGQYDFVNRAFERPLACYVENRPLKWGGFIDCHSQHWIQPNPEISIDETLVGYVETPPWVFEWAGATSPKQTTGLFLFSAEAARDVTQGSITRGDLEKRIIAFVKFATRKLAQGPRSGGLIDGLAHVEGFFAQNALRLAALPNAR
jgi:hypothetical protein